MTALPTNSQAVPGAAVSTSKRLALRYERLRSLIVWLGLVELAWLGAWLLLAGPGDSGFVWLVGTWILTMVVWLGVVIHLGRSGVYLKYTKYFSNILGLGAVLLLALGFFGLTPEGRGGLVQTAAGVSHFQLALIHVLRLLAIGTFIKYYQGQLPRHFFLLGSVPDFLFGVSAIVVSVWSALGALDSNVLLVWHIVGAIAFLGAGLSMFFSVPSALRMFDGQPDSSIVFRFPMLLAPNFTVPLFLLAHGLALLKLLG